MQTKTQPPDLYARRHWIFDLDGTLTVAVHDFDALRRQLGLPAGAPILESLETHPDGEALHAEVIAWEWSLVAATGPAVGVHALVERLAAHRLGVLTRNTSDIARATLEAVGLAGFDPVLGRDDAAPKPSPEGILRILDAWGAEADDAVMVGDFRFDLEAGRAAGVATVWVDSKGTGAWGDLADLTVPSLSALDATLRRG